MAAAQSREDTKARMCVFVFMFPISFPTTSASQHSAARIHNLQENAVLFCTKPGLMGCFGAFLPRRFRTSLVPSVIQSNYTLGRIRLSRK